MSFGPFANKYQESLSYHAIKNTTVLARDKITLGQLELLDKNRKVKKLYAPDLALFFEELKNTPMKKASSKYIVLTAREWFQNADKQKAYEQSLIALINNAWKNNKLKTIFIPMARNKIEDDDNIVADRISKNLMNKKIFSVFQPSSINEVRAILNKAQLAICTRMHSAILSTTVKTPFIAIGYGHKTLGLVQNMGLQKWHIDINKVKSKPLIRLFNNLLINNSRKEFIQTITTFQLKNQIYKQKILRELQYLTT